MRVEDQIRELVARVFQVPLESLSSKTRKADYIYARKAFAYLLRVNTSLTLSQIGLRMGGKNNASVIHMIKRSYEYIDTDKNFKHSVEYIQNLIDIEKKEPSEIVKYIMEAIVWDEKGTTRMNLENMFIN